VGVLDWEAPPKTPAVWQVVVDYAQGARQMAAHLAGLGHKRILFAGTATQTYFLDNAPERGNVASLIAAAWTATGGTWRKCSSKTLDGGEGFPDAAEVLAYFDAPDAPTAIWGLRDVEAVRLQRLLQTERPHLAASVAIVGWYDSIWSSAGDPPITSLNLNLSEIADRTVATIAALAADPHPSPCTHRIPPKLVIRQSSHRI
jgi:LacI family transcriptional regulator